jgi:hypothetical protein
MDIEKIFDDRELLTQRHVCFDPNLDELVN